jgi:adenylosuccinate synthase
LTDDVGATLARRGNEFGSVTGRPRRCGWLDVVALRRSVQLNGIDGLCITKLDVLDGCAKCRSAPATGRRRAVDLLPRGRRRRRTCEPVYETLAGWSDSTAGVNHFSELNPRGAGVPAPHRSAGRRPDRDDLDRPDRDETILIRHPFL